MRGMKTVVLAVVTALLAGAAPQSAAAQEPVLDSAAEVRCLSPTEAGSHLPVRIRAVVTFFDEVLYSRFVQDATAGIYLRESTNTPALTPGDLVEVEGTTSQGEYAPIIEPDRVRVVGKAPLPPAKPVTFEQLASGSEDSQFVEISGVVRSVRYDPGSQHYVMVLAFGGGRAAIFARQIPVPEMALVDSVVRVRGVCATLFNRQRQLFAIRLMVPRAEDLILETPAAEDPFAVGSRTIGSLLQFAPEGTYGRRAKIEGTVVLQRPGNMIFIQDGSYGLLVQTAQTNHLNIGDRVEVLGFPGQGVYTPILEDAVYRKVGTGPAPEALSIDVDTALSGTCDSRLVRLSAKLLDRSRQSREHFLVLESSNFIFQANLDRRDVGDLFAELRNGSQVSVTGVCLIEPGDWVAGEQWRARSFRLLLRSPSDVVVLKEPPWWTLRKVLWAAGLLLVLSLGALSWVGFLRKKVRQQTEIIREQMRADAALKERFEQLFENANDMVFTYDLSGGITSINAAGERMLQRKRDQILGMNLLSLIAETERASARDWLAQMVRGVEPEPAEWDLISASGQRVRVEVSSRLVEQDGKGTEVESVARDVTERRRLERELLEISNREQRRIGHDLHDGVCQQLAGIAYRVNVLGDMLEEQKRPEAVEADKIAGLISEATAQARSVARGLFPVRLEENGLIAALEELADGAAARFGVECTFECDPPEPGILDNDKALHLYYISQEALMNAVKHGRATRVQMTLKKMDERHCLSILDNGTGFQLPLAGSAGMGIRIMHYRAKVIGATLEVRSAPGKGTEVVCHFAPG